MKTMNKSTENKPKSIVRRLIPLECERLMGFPDNYTAPMGGDSARYAACGNSWASDCAHDVISGIHKVNKRLFGKFKGLKYGTISSGVECHSLSSVDFEDKAVFFSEISPAPCGLLAHHYPNVPNLGDMTLVDFDSEKKVVHNRPYDGYQEPDAKTLGFNAFKTENPVEIPCEFGEIDIVSGGTPCQSFSVAGKRDGGAEGSGTRSSLAFQLPRIGKAVGSNWIMWENVPGAFSSNGGKDFTWFLYRCMQAGYTLAWKTLDAQYTFTDKHPRAIPQRRRRIFMVGFRGEDWRVPVEALFEPLKMLGSNPPDRIVGKGWITPSGIPEGEWLRLPSKKEEKSKSKFEQCDFFDMFADVDDGTVDRTKLTDADLALDFPEEADITKLPLYKVMEFAKTLGEVQYCGDLFKKHEGEPMVDDLATKMLENIGNAGFLSKNRIVTLKTPEWNAGLTKETLAAMPKELASLYDGTVSGLSDILVSDEEVDSKYLLSWRACFGIEKRAENRGKVLPSELDEALKDRIVEQALLVKHHALTHKKDEERANALECFKRFVMPLLDETDVDVAINLDDDDIERHILAQAQYADFGPLPRPNAETNTLIEEEAEAAEANPDALGEGDEGEEE